MRISGGVLRGRTVHCPPGVIRPAMDRMRESIFSVLGSLEGSSFLDLFSGSGLVGLEAYSRGAWPVVLVEKDRRKRSVIQKNITGLSPRPQLRMEPAERFITRGRRRFSIVYLDPPFDYAFKLDLLQKLAASRLLDDNARILIHLPATEHLPEVIAPADGTHSTSPLARAEVRIYGGSAVCFYRHLRVEPGTIAPGAPTDPDESD